MYRTNLSYYLTKELFDRDYRCIVEKKKLCAYFTFQYVRIIVQFLFRIMQHHYFR